MALRLGGDRVRFVKGHIRDLALDLEAVDRHLKANPVRNASDLAALQTFEAEQRAAHPLIPDASVDLVISNCVLNLVTESERAQMVREIHRVLKPGGRVAISEIVSDATVPAPLTSDPARWSGCLSGAVQELAFLQAFAGAGFFAVRYDKWETKPWRTVQGIEFRSVTLTAVKGEDTPCLDYGHAVIYRGPYAEVRVEDDHIFPRGERIAVCERTYRLLTEGPYRGEFIGIVPALLKEPVPWCAPPSTRRPAAATKGASHESVCGNGDCC